jgi:hypothetical protein
MSDIFSHDRIQPLRVNARRWSLAALAVLVVGWSIFWIVAWWRAGAEFDARGKATPGRSYTIACSERSIGGYPLRIVVTCRDPVVTLDADGGPVTLRFTQFRSRSWLHAPSLLSTDLRGPLDIERPSSNLALRADWSSLILDIRNRDPVFDRVSIWADDVTLTCASCTARADVLRVAALQGSVRRAGGARRDYNAAASFAGVRWPALDAATGNDAPGTIALIGSISQFHAPQSMKVSDELEQWRADGGRINLNTLSLDKGILHAAVAGNIGLDPAHRPEGSYEISARNATSLLAFATRSLPPLPQLVIGAVLRAVDEASRAEDMSLTLTGTIEAGAASLGPVRNVLTIPPLY